ncbi:hypothetical protein EBT25_05820, partial [bacterium]|nr:hypothetical protein [bacterium]
CFAMLARWRNVRGHEDIGDQVSAIWRQHGFYVFTITQDDARAIWEKIPGSSEKRMTERETNGSLPIGSFVARALTLSNGK